MSTPVGTVLKVYLIGLCMGAADGVPGVSGGTIALIVGVYTRLIDAISSLTPRNGYRFLAALLAADSETMREVLGDVDAAFLLPLGGGILTAVVVVTRVVDYANEHYPIALFGFLFGLIAASVVVLARQLTVSEPRHYGAALAGFLVAFVLSGDVAVTQGDGTAVVFVAGAIAVSAMILPGISGSLILVILGQYVFLSRTLTEFTDRVAALFSGGTVDSLLDPGTTIGIFLLGAATGLVTAVNVIKYFLDYDTKTTLVFLVSLVVGALRAPIAEIGSRGIGWTAPTVGKFGVAAFVGAVILYGLDHYAIDVEIDAAAASGRDERVPADRS